MNKLPVIFSFAAILAAGCTEGLELTEPLPDAEIRTVIEVGVAGTKTSISGPENGLRRMAWTAGDRLSLDGRVSLPLAGEYDGLQTARFEWEGTPADGHILYPASFYKSPSTVVLPYSQEKMPGEDDIATDSFPMCGVASDGSSTLQALCSIVKIRWVERSAGADRDSITYLEFSGRQNEQVSGEFTIDYATASLTGTSGSPADRKVRAFSIKPTCSDTMVCNIVVPSGTYEKGFSVRVVDSKGHFMDVYTNKSKTLQKGVVHAMPCFQFKPGSRLDAMAPASAGELIAFAGDYNAGRFEGGAANIRLASDIEFTADELSAWNALGGIGTAGNPYKGTFDGNGFSIKNITSSNPIFASLDAEAVIKNVKIDSTCTFTGYASLALEAAGTIENCINYADVTHSCEVSSGCAVGGLVARLLPGTKMNSCTNAGDVTLILTSTCKGVRMGGVAAVSSGEVTLDKCANTGFIHLDATNLKGDVSGEGSTNTDMMMGGIIGCAEGKTAVKDADNSGLVFCDVDISQKINQRPSIIGGIAGSVSGASSVISGCHMTGGLRNTNFNNSEDLAGVVSGGIAGALIGADGGVATISGCTVAGPDEMQNQRGIQGGIVGYLDYGEVSDCYFSKQTVNCSQNIPHFNGGICAKAFRSTIGGCTAEDTFQACKSSAKTSIGGICGWIDGNSKVVGNTASGIHLARNTSSDFIFGAVVGSIGSTTAEISGNSYEGFYSTDSGDTYTAFSGSDVCSSSSFVVNSPNVLVDNPYTFSGIVCCGNTPLVGVVVTDGVKSVLTNDNGKFYFDTPASKVSFVSVCLPEGYEAPVENGLPKFFVKVNGSPRTSIRFDLKKMPNPDRFSLAITADPQPRSSSARYDAFAYHALTGCQDVYNYVGQRAAEISDRRVYGIVLGDIVHEDMSLFAKHVANIKNYCSAMSTYHVIGNHDYNTNAANMKAGKADFEKYFGPTDYSMNIGKFHIIVVNDIQSKLNSDGKLKDYTLGLNEDQLTWLEGDLKYVPTTTPIIVCAHSPLFARQVSTNKNVTYTESGATGASTYLSLLSKYDKVYMFGGHMHHNFTFIYAKENSSQTAKKGIESIQLARCAGALWINEYINTDGTPRGFLMADIDGTSISWQFKPLPLQSSAFVGKYGGDFSYPAPSYSYRDWTYVSGVAKIGGKTLDESYQMKLYPSFDISGTSYMLANVFMYDARWENPVMHYTDGSGARKDVTMQRYTLSSGAYDPAYRDLTLYYCDRNSYWKDAAGTAVEYNAHMFRCEMPSDCPSKSATVTVTDRFGNNYSSNVTW